jgi:hypothetical protein
MIGMIGPKHSLVVNVSMKPKLCTQITLVAEQ